MSRPHGQRRLEGGRAIVTGASSGVGRALAWELARRGVRVLATARRADRLAALVAEADGTAGMIVPLAGDLLDAGFRAALVAAARDRLGGLDLLVAAAGSGAIGAFRDAAPETLGRILAIDLVAPLELVRASLPDLRRGRDPAVVLVGSILGLHPLPLHGEYAAAKSALTSLAKTLRLELAVDGIDVLLATLGPVESEFWDSLVAGTRPAWPRGRPLPAAEAAAAIVRGLVRRRAEVLPGWRARGFAWLARFLPGLIDRVASRHLTLAPAEPAEPTDRGNVP